MSAKFVHLHVHSEYSLLDGLSKIKKLVKKAKEQEMNSLALTDHGVMYGIVEFYKECTKEGIKPLIGMEGYIVNRDLHDKSGKGENNHLLLLAKNHEGYKNLMKLSSIAQLEGFYYRPRFDKETLKKYSKGLIATSSCPKGEVGQLLINGNYQEAKKAVEWYADLFGPENYYLEIQRHFYEDYFDSVKNQSKILSKLQDLVKTEKIWVDGIVKLSRELGLPIVATNDAHYINQTDATAQDALVCISTGKNVSDVERIRYIDTPTFFLRDGTEMASIFSDYSEAITNTQKIADSCDVHLDLGKSIFPNVVVPNNLDASVYLTEQIYERLPSRYDKPTEEIKERIRYELEVIINKNLATYFLLMSDLANWCNNKGIIINTRGSAAGSIVSYILGITTVDPIKYLLPFERFLNPFRPTAPDIDLDIADDRREELIAYVSEKYGKDKVAQICTFGRMLARAAVRDITRVLGHPYAVGDRLAKVIPLGAQGFPMTIDRALNESTEFKVLYDTDPTSKHIVDLAREIEGNSRHISVHAAGIVISPDEMTNYTPLQLEPNGDKIITQYEMHSLLDEYGGVGLVKVDVLGIRNLSILAAARDLIEKSRGIKIDLGKIPVDDKKTFAMLARGETMGTFQLGGSGMTKWLKELKPQRIEDIMIMIALFRPGPMANIPEYIARKNGKSEVEYYHPKMEKYLDKSYGILVYQDDVLFTALEIAGYTWESVDKFRKAIGKKIPEEMAKQHEIFVEGCQKTSNMSKEEAEKLWDLFVPFQGYGFNKAHAASYGIVSYQTAYLKANYPVEYMTALLTAESGNTEKIVEAIDECKRMKIKVLAPDVNKSGTDFTIEDGTSIRFGLSAIKNVGDVAITLILDVRSSGVFTSLTDLCLRVDAGKVNRKVLESLIKTGALDSFGKRSAMLAGLDKIRDQGMSLNKAKSLGQFSLFGEETGPKDTTDNLPDIEEIEKKQKLNLEKELLGFYLTEHPHSELLTQLNQSVSHQLADLFADDFAGKNVITGGVIESCRIVMTKTNNQPMCFAKISDLVRSIEIVVFPKVYALTSSLWQVDNLIMVSGRLENKQASEPLEDSAENSQEITLIADSAVQFTGPQTVLPVGASRTNGNPSSYSRPETLSTPKSPVTIEIPKGLPQAKLVALNTLLQAHKGSQPAELLFLNGSSAKTIPLPYGLKWGEPLKVEISKLLSL